MTILNDKDLKDCTIAELTEYLNTFRRAAGQSPVTEKSFKNKKLLLEAIVKAEAEVKAPNAQQVENKKTKQGAAEKRLAGLQDLKERKAEEADQKRQKKDKAPKKSVSAKTEKPAKKERSAAGEGKRGGKGVGAFCCELILKGKNNAEIAEAACKEFGGKTSPSSVNWYRNKLRKEGKL